MLHNDKLYLESKLILCGKAKIPREVKELKIYLKNKFGAELINADIYRQPVFKEMAPALRLMLDKNQGYGTLPALMEERQIKIGKPFNEIIKKTDNDSFKPFIDTTLSIDYFDFNYYKFKECSHNVESFFRENLVGISNIYRFDNTIFLVYPTRDTAESIKASNLSSEVLSKAKELVRVNGYDGTYLSRINIQILDKPTIDRAGGFNNLLK